MWNSLTRKCWEIERDGLPGSHAWSEIGHPHLQRGVASAAARSHPVSFETTIGTRHDHQGPPRHLCTECQRKLERGWLAHDFVLECVSCGRNTVDNPEVAKWHSTPAAADSGKQSLSVCADCFEADPDRFPRFRLP
jgi:hypothetical protein